MSEDQKIDEILLLLKEKEKQAIFHYLPALANLVLWLVTVTCVLAGYYYSILGTQNELIRVTKENAKHIEELKAFKPDETRKLLIEFQKSQEALQKTISELSVKQRERIELTILPEIDRQLTDINKRLGIKNNKLTVMLQKSEP